MAGWLVDRPDIESDDPIGDIGSQPDPFGDEGVGLVETYGYGYNWGTYDLGCGPDAVRDPISVAFSGIANFVFDAGLTMGAAAETAQQYVFNSPLEFLNGTVSETQSAVLNTIWQVWFPVTLMAVGIYVLVRARRAEFSQTTQTTLLIVAVLAASVYLLNWPIKAMTGADAVVSEGIQIATSPFGNEPIQEQMARTIYYPAWLRGELGSDTSAVAQEYGEALFKSQHYSWTEMAVLESATLADTSALQEAKGEQFEQVASQIREAYPTAYEHLIGRSGENRLGTAFLVLPFSAASALFVVVCMGLLLLALMIIRGFILAFPIVGLVGAHPLGRPALSRLWDLLTAAIWNVLKFAFTIGLFLVIAGALLSADISALAKIFFLIVLTVAVFAIARPFRAAKAMIPGVDPDRSYLLSGLRRLRGGGRQPDDTLADGTTRDPDKVSTDAPGHERPHGRPSDEEESLPPLKPQPVFVHASPNGDPQPNGNGPKGDDTIPPDDDHYSAAPEPDDWRAPAGSASNGGTPPSAAAAAAAGANGAPSPNGAAPRGGGGYRVSGTGYPLAPLPPNAVDPAVGYGGDSSSNGLGSGFASRAEIANGQPTGRHARRAAEAPDADTYVVYGSDVSGSQAQARLPTGAPGPEPSMPPANPGRRLAIEGEQTEPVYRRNYDTAPEPVGELPMSEPVIDDDGNQVYVIYQRMPRGSL